MDVLFIQQAFAKQAVNKSAMYEIKYAVMKGKKRHQENRKSKLIDKRTLGSAAGQEPENRKGLKWL